MASPLETYINKMNKIDKMSDVNLPGGVSVYNRKDERDKASNEYVSSLPKRPDAPEFRLMGSPSREAKRNRQQNQAMDAKVMQEAQIRNSFDQARNLGGDIGVKQIRDIGMSQPGAQSIFNRMYKDDGITFSELTKERGRPSMPYKPSDTDMMQMENLIRKNGMMPDDIKANPAMARVFETSPKLQALAQRNVDSMLRAEEDQLASQRRDKQYNEQKSMEEAAYMDEVLKDKRYFGPGLDVDKVNLLSKDFVKYGDDNLMQMAGLLGADMKNEIGGEHAYLNLRNKLSEHGATPERLKEFDNNFTGNRIKNMEMDLKESTPKSMQRMPKQIVEDRMLASMQPKKVKSKYNAPKSRKQPVRSLLTRAQLEGQKFASAVKEDDSWKKYVQEGGYIRPDGKQGYIIGGLATALAPAALTAVKSGLAAEGGGGMLSNVMSSLGGMKDKYISNPIAAGKLEDLMADGTDEATARQMRDEDGMGKADFTTAFTRGGKEFVKDSAEGIATGVGGVVGGIGKGLQAGYKGLTDNKASYEDLVAGKEKGSLLQRLGKGLTMAGSAVDVMNAPDPSQAIDTPNVKFFQGKKGGEKVQNINLESEDPNADLEVTEEEYKPPLPEQKEVNMDDRLNNSDNTSVDFNKEVNEGPPPDWMQDMISPVDKAKTIDDVKNMSDDDIKNIQSSLGITVDGKVGPETTTAFNKYLASKATQKQEGGFISGLMQYQMGGYV